MKTIVIILTLFSTSIAADLPSTDTTFSSPTQRYSITFKRIKNVTYKRHDNIDEFNHIIYTICFLEGATSRQFHAKFVDVYNKRKPSQIKDIFKNIDWSPKDDIAILPEEDWASYPVPHRYTAVNLTGRYSWKISRFQLTDFKWINSIEAIGNNENDCHNGIGFFNGRSGKSCEIISPSSPNGYRVHAKTDSGLVIITSLDNCATIDQSKHFVPRQYFLEFKTLRLKPIKGAP